MGKHCRLAQGEAECERTALHSDVELYRGPAVWLFAARADDRSCGVAGWERHATIGASAKSCVDRPDNSGYASALRICNCNCACYPRVCFFVANKMGICVASSRRRAQSRPLWRHKSRNLPDCSHGAGRSFCRPGRSHRSDGSSSKSN